MSDATIRAGIGGWTFPPWRGVFYPDKHPQAKELDYAVSHLGAIEINATFYGRQSAKSWEKWGNAAPDGFQFAIKASRYCVSRSKLAEGGESIANFLGQGFEVLGPKLGPILWQFGPRKTFDRDDIAAFIDLIPDQIGDLKLRHAFEPRHASFDDEAFFDLCRARDIAVVLEDSDVYPTIDVDTASFRYARLQRMREEVVTGYDDAALDGFAEQARAWQAAGRDAYVFFINGAKVRAPAAALALQERLR
ncbi:DUF72 domain-containing protein [Sphingomonas lutea]|uniref:DUF72 domain-containing protein n=1 Tax=Sphingomonas lutea TaxID=1045317 RepID=A0A7G9SKM9_9SPHN|nr:DUF72 domain-containing protein [Sphingomonas lutea]QNN68404.1 DUF72 domain-containing protein [Sphingomonas lutea]